MAETITNILLLLLGIYSAIGVLFSIPFAFIGAGKIDSTAAGGTIGFKLLIIPGAIAFWPLLANRWRKKAGEPPEEKNPHRVAACKRHALADRRSAE